MSNDSNQQSPLRRSIDNPEDPESASHVSESEEYQERFDVRGPIFLFDMYTRSIESGFVPPDWVLLALYSAFVNFMDEEGSRSLDEILRVKSPGRGRSHPIKARRIERDRWLRALVLHDLVERFGVSVDDAAYMVECRDREYDPNCPKASWIAEDYRKNYRKSFKNKFEGMFVIGDGSKESKEVDREFLSTFPEWSFPRGFKSRL